MSAESGIPSLARAERHYVRRRLRARDRVRRHRPRRRRVERGELPRSAAPRRPLGTGGLAATSTSARSAATSPTHSRPSPKACAASARSSGASSTRRRRRQKLEEVTKKHIDGLRRLRSGASPSRREARAARGEAAAKARSSTSTSPLELTPKARTATARREARRPRSNRRRPRSFAKAGASSWAIQAFRELDDALLELRFNQPNIGVVSIETEGDAAAVLAVDAMLAKHKDDGLVREVTLLMKRVLKRLDLTAKSFFALVDARAPASSAAFSSSALASDRIYMKETDEDEEVSVATLGDERRRLPDGERPLAPADALPRGARARARACSSRSSSRRRTRSRPASSPFAPDDIDWDDEIRIAFEERAAMSPDALTGMEASSALPARRRWRPRSSAASRPGRTGSSSAPTPSASAGALTLYGKPERPEFNWKRT